ncbi:MAG: tRNA uracil 4-sulfurtransferase ThiI [Gemmatimonadota bacterium]
MSESKETLVLVRLSSELSTKARGTRRRFMRRLVQNVRDAMETTGSDFAVESQWTRIFIRTSAQPEALEVLRHVPGVSSYSVVVGSCGADMDEIVRTAMENFGESVKGRTFAVRARRHGTHPFSSSDLMRAIGSALNPGAKVDLSDPDIEVEVEVRDQDVYFFSGRHQALGGLPLAVEGRAVCLLSGGFDSAVAAWMMLKRGVQLDYVFCNLAGDAYERSVARVGKILADDWSFGTKPKLHIVEFADVLDDLRAHTQPRYWQLILKRLMYRAADRIAGEIRSQAIVTGEAIGQVSSQTLANLTAIDGASRLPVFRPLIGFDKMDIIELSRRVGTFDVSSTVKEYCAIAPGNPATSATARETEAEDAKLDAHVLLRAVESRRILDLRALSAADLVVGYLFTDELPGGAVVVDLRSEEEWEAWHYPGSVNRESWTLTSNPRSLGRDGRFVLYCDQGVQSAQVAEAMQRAGVEAYAFRGGTDAIRRRSEEAPSGS